MGTHKYGMTRTHRVTFSRYTTSRIDTARLKKERPEIAAAYSNESKNGRITVKELEV